MNDYKNKPDSYWKEKLTPEEYHILREKGTEQPFTGKYYLNQDTGIYECGACGQPLFSSDAKFDAACGWPSFDDPMSKETVALRDDFSHGTHRVEVICKNCGSHLGHVFDDGPTDTTGKRYCINSTAINFKPKK